MLKATVQERKGEKRRVEKGREIRVQRKEGERERESRDKTTDFKSIRAAVHCCEEGVFVSLDWAKAYCYLDRIE